MYMTVAPAVLERELFVVIKEIQFSYHRIIGMDDGMDPYAKEPRLKLPVPDGGVTPANLLAIVPRFHSPLLT
jgi:hypothetical protein